MQINPAQTVGHVRLARGRPTSAPTIKVFIDLSFPRQATLVAFSFCHFLICYNYSMQTFSQRVVKIALDIPKGRVTTYGRIARAAGAGPMASQSITNILGKAYEQGEKKYSFSSHRIC